MVIKKNIFEVFLQTDEKKEADFIKRTLVHWSEIKKEALPIVTKMKKCWEKETKTREALEYLG